MTAPLPWLLVLAAVLEGCLASAPRSRNATLGADPTGADAKGTELRDVPVKGFPVRVTRKHEGALTGELLGTDAQHLFLLTEGGAVVLHHGETDEVTVDVLTSSFGLTGLAWTGGGILSTISHGFVLLLTAPTWLLAGGAATIAASASQRAEFSRASYPMLREYARFPQGVPPAVLDCPEHPHTVQPVLEPEPVPPGMPPVVPAYDPSSAPPPQL